MARKRGSFDYIIVGAGSSGCVLAHRLSEDPSIRVLLLEAGPIDRHWSIRIPGGIRYHQKLGSPFNWHFWTEPQPQLDGRQIYQPRGKVLGGSSSINGMVFLRGHRLDFSRWVQQGARGWSYEAVLPYFKRLETHYGEPSAYRGTGGPVGVRRQEDLIALDEAFLAAGRAAGYPTTDDPNAEEQEGFARFDMNVCRGIRQSAAVAYLHNGPRRRNLTVRTDQQVHKIIIEAGRAVGVAYGDPECSGVERAEREVILTAGAFGSPQLLMLSGIGPADHLRSLEIPLQVDRPGVGENLHDHIEVHVQHRCRKAVSLNGYLNPLGYASCGLQWLFHRSGAAARSQMNAGAFLCSNENVAHPNIQFHFFPAFFNDRAPVPGVHGYRLGAGPVRPSSRGRVRLLSNDPAAAVSIDPNYLATEHDRQEMREAFELARETLAQSPFKEFDAGEVNPGPAAKSREDIDAYIRRTASSAYHPCGTCRMGSPQDDLAVVDPDCRVVGVSGLRVVDASIMPSVVSGNTNAAVMMMAERASDLIRGRTIGSA